MKHNEQQQTGNPKPSGNLSYYNTIEEKEKTLAATLNKKYGKGTLDIKTGEFTPTK